MIGMKSEGGFLLFRKFITSKIFFSKKHRDPLTIKVMKCSTNEADPSPLNSVAIKNKKPSRDMKNILKHFKDDNWIDHVNEVPRRVLRSTKSKSYQLYLFDDKTADRFVNLIKDDLLKGPKKIIEANPGLGILTEKLLNTGVPYLNVMEPNLKFVQALVNLQQRYPKSMMIQEADLFNIWKIACQDKHDDGNRVRKLFSDFPQIKWEDEPGLKIIGTTTTIDFIKHLIIDVVKQSGIVSYGRPYLYMCMPPSAWLRLTCDKTAGLSEYRSTTVLFQLLFDYKLLDHVPRKSFLPWPLSLNEKKNGKLTKQEKMDKDNLCIVKIEGKKNLFTEMVHEKHIQLLWYFINHHMIARTGRVIPQMETWHPGCGPKLIAQNYNIFTQFGDLSPQELLELFNEFTSWDGFHNSFIPSLENSLQKVEQLLF